MRVEDISGGRKVCCSCGPGGAWASKPYSWEPGLGRHKAPDSQGSDLACLNILNTAKPTMVDIYMQEPHPWVYLGLV